MKMDAQTTDQAILRELGTHLARNWTQASLGEQAGVAGGWRGEIRANHRRVLAP